MIRLDATNKTIEVVLAGAITTNQLPVVATYNDFNSSANTITPAESDTVTNNTTAVTAVAAPAAGVVRNLDYLGVYNKDTANATVTVQLHDGANTRELYKTTLAPGQALTYARERGWADPALTFSSTVTIGAGSAIIGQVEMTDGTNVLGTAAHPVQVSLANTATNAVAVKVDGSGATQPVSFTGTVATNADMGVGGALPSSALVVAGSDGTLAHALATTNAGVLKVDLSATAANSTAVKVDGTGGTFPVSGTVSAAQSGTWNIGTVTTVGSLGGTVATNADTTIAGTSAPSKGLLVVGKTADVTPAYDPLPLAAGGGSLLVSGTVTANQGGTWNVGTVTTVTTVTNLAQEGGVAVTLNKGASDAGTRRVTLGDGAQVIGSLTANQSVNVAQVGGSNLVTAATGVQKVGVVGNAGATVDSTAAAGTAPTNAVLVSSVYNATAPAPTDTQALAQQADQAGNLRTAPGMAVATLSVWNSGTSLNATQNVFTNSGCPAVLVHLVQSSGTFSAGAITFEITYNGSSWITIPADQVIDPTSTTQATISLPYTLVTSTNKGFLLLCGGAQGLRIKLSTAITGTGTVTPNYALLPYAPVQQAVLGAGSAVVGAVTQSGTWNVGTVTTITNAVATNADATAGSAVPAKSLLVSGTDGTNARTISTTNAGVVKVDLSATAANATAVKVDGTGGSFPVSGTVTANQGGTWTVQPGNTANTTAWLVSTNCQIGTGGAVPANGLMIGGTDSGTFRYLACTSGGLLKVDGSGVTQPVSGTVTANAGTGTFNVASANLELAQASTTSGQKGPLVQGAVTTSAPSYTTAQTDPLSLTTAGQLRVFDTNLPAAATLADSTSLPTTTIIGTVPMMHNGTNLDIERANAVGTALASASRSAQTTASVTNYGGERVTLFLNITVASGTGGLQVFLDLLDPLSGQPIQLAPSAPTAITATGIYAYQYGPGVNAPGTGNFFVNQAVQCAIGRNLRVRVAVGDASSYTYSVSYAFSG